MLRIDFSNVNISRFLCFRRNKQKDLNTQSVQNVADFALEHISKVESKKPLNCITRTADSPYQDYRMKILLENGILVHNAAFKSLTPLEEHFF